MSVAPRLRRREWWRRLLRHPGLRRAACWTIHCYIRFVYLTNRWRIEGGARPRRLFAEGRVFIGAFWHGRMMLIPMAWRQMAPMHMLISTHRDGQLIAGAMTYFGIDAIAGSTRRGGSSALRAMLKRLADGNCVAITPDGPRGPAMQASLGIVNLARLARVPIQPVTYATSRRRLLDTWDRYHLALPFGRGVILWGEPIEIPAELDAAGLEDARSLVETRMNEMVREADRLVGHGIHPAPAEAGRVGRPPRRREWAVMLPRLYRLMTLPLPPLAIRYLKWRCRRGKEDPLRWHERRGFPGAARPPGPLLWIHAASVGEATAMLALIERLRQARPKIEILVTTGTTASARLLERRLPAGARHQFVPLDLPLWVARFLDRWRPDLAIWVESELWPNLVLMTRARGVPMVLVNGRLSARSYRRWHAWPGLIGPMLGAFSCCLAQDEGQAERLRRLGGQRVEAIGDLKAAAAALPVDGVELERLRRRSGTRPRWLAASTHGGEEAVAAAVHRRLAPAHGGLLTLIAPRHPSRGAEIAAMLARLGLRVARRSEGAPITAETDIYLADTMGELGLFYRLTGIVFVGGSLAGQGGHNPFEPARLDCAVLHGPDMTNCLGMAAALAAAGASEVVNDATELACAVSALLSRPQLLAERSAAARAAAAGSGVLDAVEERLAPWLDRLAPADPAYGPLRLPA